MYQVQENVGMRQIKTEARLQISDVIWKPDQFFVKLDRQRRYRIGFRYQQTFILEIRQWTPSQQDESNWQIQVVFGAAKTGQSVGVWGQIRCQKVSSDEA